MPISDIPIFSMLRTRINGIRNAARLSENVQFGHADYRPRDLTALKFDQSIPSGRSPLSLARTDTAIFKERPALLRFQQGAVAVTTSGRPVTRQSRRRDDQWHRTRWTTRPRLRFNRRSRPIKIALGTK